MSKWHGCYDDSWQGIIIPEAFAHPAKMAYGLTRKIFKHALSESWIKPGDIVIDPFGGIGSTGIVGACFGLKVVCVELEQKFVDLAKQNFERNHKYIDGFKHHGHPYYPVILQGDSRRLSEIIAGADCVVGSPPFGNSMVESADPNYAHKFHGKQDNYGQTPGQLGAMKTGRIDSIISSPPFADTLKGDSSQNETAAESRAKRKTEGGSLGQSQRTQGYGSKGNLGNFKPGKVSALISSPPYEGSMTAGGHLVWQNQGKVGAHKDSKGKEEIYGSTTGNLGNEQGQTFWQAAQIIVEQCHQILKPGGYAIWVVKSFVRKGKIVDFPGDWKRLCESVGFETIHEHYAMLIKETKHKSLFGQTITEKKERKSFFRRLAERKGSPAIDYEVVLCMRKEVAE